MLTFCSNLYQEQSKHKTTSVFSVNILKAETTLLFCRISVTLLIFIYMGYQYGNLDTSLHNNVSLIHHYIELIM